MPGFGLWEVLSGTGFVAQRQLIYGFRHKIIVLAGKSTTSNMARPGNAQEGRTARLADSSAS
jgi:hypothetical protein